MAGLVFCSGSGDLDETTFRPLHSGSESGEQEATPKQVLSRRLKKTKICNYWIRGCCIAGAECRFAHGQHEVVEKPDLSKTKMCRYQLFPDGCRVPNCRFAHSDDELAQAEEKVLRLLSGKSDDVSTRNSIDSSNAPGVEASANQAFDVDHTNLAGWSRHYEAQLQHLAELVGCIDSQNVRTFGLCSLVSNRVQAYARAAATNPVSPLPQLTRETMLRESWILQMVSATHYED